MSIYDIINGINRGQKLEINSEKEYIPYIVNRTYSYFPDTILAANEMNIRAEVPKELQYEFFLNIIRPAKRFAKWVKRVDSEDFETVQQYLKLSNAKTLEALQLLSNDDIEKMRRALDPGG